MLQSGHNHSSLHSRRLLEIQLKTWTPPPSLNPSVQLFLDLRFINMAKPRNQ